MACEAKPHQYAMVRQDELALAKEFFDAGFACLVEFEARRKYGAATERGPLTIDPLWRTLARPIVTTALREMTLGQEVTLLRRLITMDILDLSPQDRVVRIEVWTEHYEQFRAEILRRLGERERREVLSREGNFDEAMFDWLWCRWHLFRIRCAGLAFQLKMPPAVVAALAISTKHLYDKLGAPVIALARRS